MQSKTSVPNKLIDEKSPYLLQHAYNPVEWHPWKEETFQLAKKLEKPIFLSVGYSACYWCHVMEREVFENEEIAELMNEYFVNVKVDREERPDVDRVYMTVLQAITGSGGWPMSLFLTPDLKPFYAATYIPPKAKYGRAGFEDVINEIHKLWNSKRSEIEVSGDGIIASIKKSLDLNKGGASGDLSKSLFFNPLTQFEKIFDPENGGFGSGNKFPRPVAFDYLLNFYHNSKEFPALDMTLFSLKKMYEGGMYDHLGGGFHRYAVDVYWRVPHFEKMLYDQAQLIKTYSNAYRITGKKFFLFVAEETARYLFSNLLSPEGGFYSAEDAESAVDPAYPNDKEEGAYYLWLKSDIDEALGVDDSKVFCYYFGIDLLGNTIHDPHEVFGKKNVLYIAHDVYESAAKFGKTVEEISEIIDRSRDKLLAIRKQRQAPSLDDKILTNWNALTISSLCALFCASGEKIYIDKAIAAMDFILSNLSSGTPDTLLHRYKDDEARFDGTLEDYSFVISALIDLYECTFDVSYLKKAMALNEIVMKKFFDNDNGGFFDVDPNVKDIIINTKDIYDGAEPSGNSVQILNLLRLSAMSDNGKLKDAAEKSLKLFAEDIKRMPFSSPEMLSSLNFFLTEPTEIIISGDRTDQLFIRLSEYVRSFYLPQSVIMNSSEEMTELFPFIKNIVEMGDETLVYICRNHACSLPTNDKEKIKELLSNETVLEKEE
jgi:uncharacterized protein YyaL (SSP411 family)